MASTTMVRPGEVVVLAISRGDLSRVKDMLDNGASVNERGRHATTALHWAASADEVDIVTTLLAHGGDPNLRAADGCTPLHYAVREDAVRSVEALLKGGADPELKNNKGNTPGDEIYDKEDEDGSLIAVALRRGSQKSKNEARDDGGTKTLNSTSSASTATRGSTAPSSTSNETLLVSLFGGGSDDALERAMGDMAKLLRSSGGAQLAAVDATSSSATVPVTDHTSTIPSTSTSHQPHSTSSGSGGSESLTGKTLTPRKYVPAAEHDEPNPATKSGASIKITLTKSGALLDSDYLKVRDEYLGSGPGELRVGGFTQQPGVTYERVASVAVTKAEKRRGEDVGK